MRRNTSCSVVGSALLGSAFLVAGCTPTGGDEARGPTAAQVEVAKTDIAYLEVSVEMYQLQKKRCPEDMVALKAAGIIREVIKDPWGRAYVITCPGEHGHVDIHSMGADKRDEGDDINSWEMTAEDRR